MMIRPWYSEPTIERDRSHVMEHLETTLVKDTSRFILVSDHGILHYQLSSSTSPDHHEPTGSRIEPWYLSKLQMEFILSQYHRNPTTLIDLACTVYATSSNGNKNDDDDDDDGHHHKTNEDDNTTNPPPSSPLLAWVGKYQDHDYWVIQLKGISMEEIISISDEMDHPVNVEVDIDIDIATPMISSSSCAQGFHELPVPTFLGLREFGDRLESSVDAGILATATALVEFHNTHGFCSICGGSTIPSKVGGCRRCQQCPTSVYPRMDIATIMLITSSCGNYALLGRKASWPMGRYSTLAGFCEVGETLEDCCIRETYEESGVHVDPTSIRFLASQPWPFPRSLMVGFHARAIHQSRSETSSSSSSPSDTTTTTTTASTKAATVLPTIQIDTNEMQDVQWFHKDFVRQRLNGGSTALGYQPRNKDEAEFHIPGRASLARVLITKWIDGLNLN